ncbi:DJ-1 protein-PfpI domain-containing protein [Favolaschia claudopus]|uniref:DJ-1 protein-PfpI domain-containing protein n=1 Tax=Favolaschia claudopus TaxID=2862362 RepID=A0AAW0BU69_9AGAR
MKNHSPLLSSAASTSSFQSFDTVQKAPSTAATSVADSDDHRWSEEKDLLTFSTAKLSECSPDIQSPDSPTDAFDNRSQILTITASVAPTAAVTPGTMQFFQQNHDFLFTDPNFYPSRPGRGRTQTSLNSGCWMGDFAFDPYTSFAHAHMWAKGMETKEMPRDDVSDEGFFEGHQFAGMDNEFNLPSRFSGTTTSTSNFVNVEREFDEASADWSTLEAPDTPGYHHPTAVPLHPLMFWSAEIITIRPAPRRPRPPRPTLPARGRLLPSAPRLRTLSRVRSLPKIARNITGRWKKTSDGAGWVWIDVKERSTSA